MYSDKPILKLMDMSIDDSDLTASLQVLFPQEHYTVIFGVYSKRGQLLGVKRVDFSNTDLATEFTVNFENVGAADYVAVSAVEKFSLKPLWTTITKNI